MVQRGGLRSLAPLPRGGEGGLEELEPGEGTASSALIRESKTGEIQIGQEFLRGVGSWPGARLLGTPELM